MLLHCTVGIPAVWATVHHSSLHASSLYCGNRRSLGNSPPQQSPHFFIVLWESQFGQQSTTAVSTLLHCTVGIPAVFTTAVSTLLHCTVGIPEAVWATVHHSSLHASSLYCGNRRSLGNSPPQQSPHFFIVLWESQKFGQQSTTAVSTLLHCTVGIPEVWVTVHHSSLHTSSLYCGNPSSLGNSSPQQSPHFFIVLWESQQFGQQFTTAVSTLLHCTVGIPAVWATVHHSSLHASSLYCGNRRSLGNSPPQQSPHFFTVLWESQLFGQQSTTAVSTLLHCTVGIPAVWATVHHSSLHTVFTLSSPCMPMLCNIPLHMQRSPHYHVEEEDFCTLVYKIKKQLY